MIANPARSSRLIRRFLLRLVVLVAIVVGFMVFATHYMVPTTVPGVGIILFKGGLKQVVSPQAGWIQSYAKEEGDPISKGDVLALMRAHGNADKEVPIYAHVAGQIAEIIAYPDTVVSQGQPIAIITDAKNPLLDLEMLSFVSSLDGKKIQPGMLVRITPSIVDPLRTGHLLARVKRVGKLPMSLAAVQSVVKIPEVAHYIRDQLSAEPFVVVLSLNQDPEHITGYAWDGPGPNFMLDSGIIAQASIVTEEKSLAARIFPMLFHGALGVH